MFKCKIYLYCVQFVKNNICFISLSDQKFIALECDLDVESKDSILDSLYTIIDTYTTVNPKAIKLTLLDIYKKDEYINIHYMCILPIDNKLVNAYYIPYNTVCTDPIIQKVVRYV